MSALSDEAHAIETLHEYLTEPRAKQALVKLQFASRSVGRMQAQCDECRGNLWVPLLPPLENSLMGEYAPCPSCQPSE